MKIASKLIVLVVLAATPLVAAEQKKPAADAVFINAAAPAHDLGAGAYHFLPGKMHHAAEARGETVLQLHGNGPFDIHYLNPADNPNKAAAR